MPTGFEKEILDGGIAAIKAIADRPPTAWPNVKPDGIPPDEGLWLEVLWFPADSGDPFWDNDAPVRASGFFQILVCGQLDQGVVAEDEASRILEAMPKGTQFGPVRMRKRGDMAPAVYEPHRVFVQVTLPYDGMVT